MRHSIISWDNSYRNFFHLVPALYTQEYPIQEIEVIFVEQRSREIADSYNHKLGFKSLSDLCDEFPDTFFRPLYLNDQSGNVYHLGRCINHGLQHATGEIITIMDGDMLLPPDFLTELDRAHAVGPAVVNAERKMCPRPVGADFENWDQGNFEYGKCLEICRSPGFIPKYVTNKGPMISSRRSAFEKSGGYDEHAMFGTGLSRAGQDMNTRLEIASGCRSQVLNRQIVHPYHPQGFSRKTLDAVRVLKVQADVIRYTRKHNIYSWTKRSTYLDEVYRRNKALFHRVHNGDYENDKNSSIHTSILIGRLYSLALQLFHPFRP